MSTVAFAMLPTLGKLRSAFQMRIDLERRRLRTEKPLAGGLCKFRQMRQPSSYLLI